MDQGLGFGDQGLGFGVRALSSDFQSHDSKISILKPSSDSSCACLISRSAANLKTSTTVVDLYEVSLSEDVHNCVDFL